MMHLIKSEWLKLFTVRSTYILLLSAFALISLFTYLGTSPSTYEEAVCEPTGDVLYSQGQTDPRLETAPPEELCDGPVNYELKTSRDLSEDRLLFGLQESVPLIATFVTIILVLLTTHEYRHNLINYTLTISSSRSKVLLAKLIVSTVFTIVATLLAIGLTLAMFALAVNVKDLHLPAQNYDWLYVMGRHFGYSLGYVLFFVGLATLLRNLTAAIAAIFLVPTVDGIVGFLLSTRELEPTKFLPFFSLDRFGNVASDISYGTADVGETFLNANPGEPASAMLALGVFSVYLAAVWIAGWILFMRRDAS